MDRFMRRAIKEAEIGISKDDGGPFGAVIVRNGRVVVTGHNEVIRTNDPTMHAEIAAIRAATRKLKRFDLSDCTMYITCQPCPMCFAAIQWAGIKKIYYGATCDDAAAIGFSDRQIYDVIRGTAKKKSVSSHSMNRGECLVPMRRWFADTKRKLY